VVYATQSIYERWLTPVSSVLSPEAVLDDPDEKEEDAAGKCADSQAHEGASEVVLDGADA